jgi:hypothetical protein
MGNDGFIAGPGGVYGGEVCDGYLVRLKYSRPPCRSEAGGLVGWDDGEGEGCDATGSGVRAGLSVSRSPIWPSAEPIRAHLRARQTLRTPTAEHQPPASALGRTNRSLRFKTFRHVSAAPPSGTSTETDHGGSVSVTRTRATFLVSFSSDSKSGSRTVTT